jgi:hypothetical protein
MTTFILTLDLSGNEHPHSPMAHRHFVSEMLGRVSQQMSGVARQGDIVAGPAFGQKKVGAWRFMTDGPDDPVEELQQILES